MLRTTAVLLAAIAVSASAQSNYNAPQHEAQAYNNYGPPPGYGQGSAPADQEYSPNGPQQPQPPVLHPPPYQFEKTKHWIQYKVRGEASAADPSRQAAAQEVNLVRLIKNDQGSALFGIDTSHAVFTLAASGHAVAGQSLCPASMYVELAARCAAALVGDLSGYVIYCSQLLHKAPDMKVVGAFCRAILACEAAANEKAKEN